MNKITINMIIFVLLTLGVAVFDSVLQLGNFHGLVFSLYLLYGSVLITLVNLILGWVYWNKERGSAKQYLISAAIILPLGFVIGWIAGGLIQQYRKLYIILFERLR